MAGIKQGTHRLLYGETWKTYFAKHIIRPTLLRFQGEERGALIKEGGKGLVCGGGRARDSSK